MPREPDTYSLEYLFHAPDCDVQFAVGPFDDRVDAARLAEEVPSLVRMGDEMFLSLQGHEYLVDPSSIIVHGDLPPPVERAALGALAFVDAWVFPSRHAAWRCAYAEEVARFWLQRPTATFDRAGLRAALLCHFREARLTRATDTSALDVYESCGKRIHVLLDELLERGWFRIARSIDPSRLHATTRLLTARPALMRAISGHLSRGNEDSRLHPSALAGAVHEFSTTSMNDPPLLW